MGRDSDVVIIKGDSQEAVDDAIDHIKNLEEEYLQDVTEKDAYTHPSSKSSNGSTNTNGGMASKGFVVRGAPWEQQNSNGGGGSTGTASSPQTPSALNPNEPAPDTNNMEDFPTITAAVTGSGSAQKTSWGPSRK